MTKFDSLEVSGDINCGGDVHLERSGSPKLRLRSTGSGFYSIRSTNNEDSEFFSSFFKDERGRKLVVRNEDGHFDVLFIEEFGNVHIERSGVDTPKLFLTSHGNGTQSYSIRTTNAADAVGGKKFVIRNEFNNVDVMTINDVGNIGIGSTDPTEKLEVNGNILATGDVILSGADCAEDFDD